MKPYIPLLIVLMLVSYCYVGVSNHRVELKVYADGPYFGLINVPINFSGRAYGGQPPYSWHWDFGDGYTSTSQNSSHIYITIGNYSVILTVTDDKNNTTNDTTWAKIKEINNPPNPPTISGPKFGKLGIKYEYTFKLTDPDEDDLDYLVVKFHGQSVNSWQGFQWSSGSEIKENFTWQGTGARKITAKTRDIYGTESNWSEPFITNITYLLLNIKSKFIFLSAEIENIGDYQLNDINWSLSVSGSWILFPQKRKTGLISTIHSGKTIRIVTPIIGLGKFTIELTTLDEIRSKNGTVIGALIFLK